MKRILLTSTALVAFAGAAAADISFSGDAEFSYNSLTGSSQAVSITASGSAALDNGYTASASITIEDADTVAGGDISISSDMATLTYHIGDDGVGAADIGGELSMQTAVAGIHDESEDQMITASVSVGGATVRASLNGDGANDSGSDYEVGVSTDLGGTSLNFGFVDGTFGVVMGGSAGTVDYTAGFASGDSYAINASTTAGGADLSLDFGDAGWEIGASMALGAATVGVTLDDAQDWELSISTALDAIELGMSIDQDSAWEVTMGYAAGAVAVNAMVNSVDDMELTGSYDIGNGLMAYVGYATGTTEVTYFGAEYDLGNGASVVISNASSGDAAADEFGQEYAEGTTVAVSFSF